MAVLLGAALAGLPTGAMGNRGAEAAEAADAQPVVLPGSRVLDVTAARSGRVYRLMIWTPTTPPPPSGYPTVYVTDGNAIFGTVREVIDVRSRVRRSSGLVPAVVVAIGYPTDDPYDIVRRSYDLTPPSDAPSMPPRPNGEPWPPLGGAAEFLAFIEDEVKPLVAGLVPVDPDREVLMGHSFGGLFALYTLFTRPGAFDVYVANSPSIWFDDSMLLDEAAGFVARTKSEPVNASLFLAVGALEQVLTRTEGADPQADARLSWKARNRMVDNAREMAGQLAVADGLSVEFRIFEGEDHSSVIPAATSRGLSFALRPEIGK